MNGFVISNFKHWKKWYYNCLFHYYIIVSYFGWNIYVWLHFMWYQMGPKSLRCCLVKLLGGFYSTAGSDDKRKYMSRQENPQEIFILCTTGRLAGLCWCQTSCCIINTKEAEETRVSEGRSHWRTVCWLVLF